MYLKHFGYLFQNDWWISVLHINSGVIKTVLIQNFSVETNVYDLPFTDLQSRRHLENTLGKVENLYNRLINNIHNQKRIGTRDSVLVDHVVASFLVRTGSFRSFLEGVLNHSEGSKDRLIREITFFSGNFESIKNQIEVCAEDFKLNLTVCYTAAHLVKVFKTFNKLVLEAPEDRGWFTSDNPVFIDKNGRSSMIVPLESELYFPLSNRYCLFMFHDESEVIHNKLRALKVSGINKIDHTLHWDLHTKICNNSNSYLIAPCPMEDYSFENEV